jgi:hypothetical protein
LAHIPQSDQVVHEFRCSSLLLVLTSSFKIFSSCLSTIHIFLQAFSSCFSSVVHVFNIFSCTICSSLLLLFLTAVHVFLPDFFPIHVPPVLHGRGGATSSTITTSESAVSTSRSGDLPSPRSFEFEQATSDPRQIRLQVIIPSRLLALCHPTVSSFLHVGAGSRRREAASSFFSHIGAGDQRREAASSSSRRG